MDNDAITHMYGIHMCVIQEMQNAFVDKVDSVHMGDFMICLVKCTQKYCTKQNVIHDEVNFFVQFKLIVYHISLLQETHD